MTYQKLSVCCLSCKSVITVCNYSKHLDSKQCKNGGKYVPRPIRHNLECIHCTKLYTTQNSVVQHELRCKSNPNKLKHTNHVVENNDFSYLNPKIPDTPCIHCRKCIIKNLSKLLKKILYQ